jgi:hypothetical protein
MSISRCTPALQPDYTSYASPASAWWDTHGSTSISLAKNFPRYWDGGVMERLDAWLWLNVTVMLGDCIAGLPSDGTNPRTTIEIMTAPSTTGIS